MEEISRCVNHPEKLSIGLCNDCGRTMCEYCLHAYEVRGEGESANLFLCPDCLEERYLRKANAPIIVGSASIVFGIIIAMFEFIPGLISILFASLLIVYGIDKRRSMKTKELSIGDLENAQERIVTEGLGNMDIYRRLLSGYVAKWGSGLGYDLLSKDIDARLRLGISYREALERLYIAQD